jgi:hypothetical protein
MVPGDDGRGVTQDHEKITKHVAKADRKVEKKERIPTKPYCTANGF